eukprot:m.258047 g.258047  ORF g.258047 m.258047 type:complete len:55 (+) comp36036_c0_seq1:129-293(+)
MNQLFIFKKNPQKTQKTKYPLQLSEVIIIVLCYFSNPWCSVPLAVMVEGDDNGG